MSEWRVDGETKREYDLSTYPPAGDTKKGTSEEGISMEHEHVNKKVLNRLARIEGHVRSIREMVASGRDCSDVLIQVAAVRSALDRAGKVILEDHLEHCIADAMKGGKEQEAIDNLKMALKSFVG